MNKFFTILGLLAGTSLLLYWGGEAPDWLLKAECLLLMGAALVIGFTARNPAMPDWMRNDSVLGVALVYIGVGLAFVPANLILSSACIGAGLRLVTRSAIEPIRARFTGTSIVRTGSDIVLRESGHIVTRE